MCDMETPFLDLSGSALRKLVLSAYNMQMN